MGGAPGGVRPVPHPIEGARHDEIGLGGGPGPAEYMYAGGASHRDLVTGVVVSDPKIRSSGAGARARHGSTFRD